VENALSCNVEKSFLNYLDPDLGRYDFQNLINSSLSKDTSMVKKHHEYPIEKLLTDKLTNEQTNKQTPV